MTFQYGRIKCYHPGLHCQNPSLLGDIINVCVMWTIWMPVISYVVLMQMIHHQNTYMSDNCWTVLAHLV